MEDKDKRENGGEKEKEKKKRKKTVESIKSGSREITPIMKVESAPTTQVPLRPLGASSTNVAANPPQRIKSAPSINLMQPTMPADNESFIKKSVVSAKVVREKPLSPFTTMHIAREDAMPISPVALQPANAQKARASLGQPVRQASRPSVASRDLPRYSEGNAFASLRKLYQLN